MAKVKTYAVPVTITRTVFVYIEARRPQGAAEKIQTEQGWAEAIRYDDDDLPFNFDPKTMTVGTPREA